MAHALLVLFGVSALTFLLTELAPGDPLSDLALDPSISAETLDALRQRRGLDRPWPARYLTWLGDLVRGDWGRSVSHDAPVADLLGQRAGNTLILALLATVLAWLIAVPLGVGVAASRSPVVKATFSLVTSVLLAVPQLVLTLALVLVGVAVGLPAGGMTSPRAAALSWSARSWDLLEHLVVPVTALVLGGLPVLVRHVEAAVDATLGAPFAATATGYGVPRRRLLIRHVLPASAHPLVGLLGLSIAGLLSGSLLVEVIVGWPGMGPLLLEAILARDHDLVIGAVMLSAMFLLAGNLVADLLLRWCDPRLRRGRSA